MRPATWADCDCLHATLIASTPIPHAPFPPFCTASTNRMPQDCKSWGRGGPRNPGAPRSKPLMALEKNFFGALKIFPLIRSAPGRARGAGPQVMGPTAGPAVPDPALLAGIRRAGAEETGARCRSPSSFVRPMIRTASILKHSRRCRDIYLKSGDHGSRRVLRRAACGGVQS